MDRPDAHRVFAAAVHVLRHAACPACGRAHHPDTGHWRCAWCADRARALDLYRQWKTRCRPAREKAPALRGTDVRAA